MDGLSIRFHLEANEVFLIFNRQEHCRIGALINVWKREGHSRRDVPVACVAKDVMHLDLARRQIEVLALHHDVFRGCKRQAASAEHSAGVIRMKRCGGQGDGKSGRKQCPSRGVIHMHDWLPSSFNSLRIRIVNEAAGAMASLIIAMYVEVWLSLPVELWPCVDCLVRIVDPASYAMAAVVAVVRKVVARRVAALVMILGHPLDERAQNGSANNSANVIPAVVIHARIGIEAVTTSMVVATHIGKNTRAALSDPDIFTARIVTPGPVQDAGAPRSLMNELRLA